MNFSTSRYKLNIICEVKLTPSVLCPSSNGVGRRLFLSLKAGCLLLWSIGSRSGGVEGDKLLVARGEGVVRCAIFAAIGDGRIDSMGRTRTDRLLEYCKKKAQMLTYCQQ